MNEKLIQRHGGYKNLKSFQIAQLIFDITQRFCNRFINCKSRTHDQMIQAARSGVQNIAEGSQASGTSKKTELKLTNVARASLEELKLDYQDFLRHNKLKMWEYNSVFGRELINRRLQTADEYSLWVKEINQKTQDPLAEIAANGLLVLLCVACTLLDRQIASQAKTFENEGGFSERLERFRRARR